MQASLERGLQLLEILARMNRAATFGELASALGQVNRASLSRLLSGLVEAGYVHKTGAGYCCGFRMAVFSYVRTGGRADYLRSRYLPVMREISDKFRVTTVLTERVQDVLIGIHRHQLEDTVHMQETGNVNDQPDQPWMKLMAAFEPRVRDLYTDRRDLAEIKRIREQGYVFADVGKLSIRRLCFPLFGADGGLIGAIGVGGTPLQITEDNRECIIKFVIKIT